MEIFAMFLSHSLQNASSLWEIRPMRKGGFVSLIVSSTDKIINKTSANIASRIIAKTCGSSLKWRREGTQEGTQKNQKFFAEVAINLFDRNVRNIRNSKEMSSSLDERITHNDDSKFIISRRYLK